MRRFLGALGLRGHERVSAGQGSRAELRWAIPLPRALAQIAKECLEQAPGGVHKDLFVPKHPSRIEAFEAQFADLPSGRVGYVAGASFGSLRRVLLVDAHGESVEAARRSAERTLREVGLGALTRQPEHGDAYRHLRAAWALRVDPRRYTELYADAEAWPPSLEVLAALERELQIAPSESASVRTVADRVTDFALVRERLLPSAPILYSVSDNAAEVAEICEHGYLAPRWRLTGYGIRPTSLSGVEDLKGVGGAYVALKMLPRARLNTFIQEESAYIVTVSDLAFDRIERHVVDRDQYGTLAGLEQGMSEAALRAAIQGELLTPEHEALFPDGLPPSLILGVICREASDEARLREALEGMRARVRTIVGDRYVAV